jgi:hypothetical protein
MRVWSLSSSLAALDISVGRNLEAPVTVKLMDPAEDDGLEVTIRSNDPARLRISKSPDQAGTTSLVVTVRQGFRETSEFWLQGLNDSGTVTYTAEAKGYSAGKGTVTLTPSGIAVVGPLRSPTYVTTSGASPTRLTIASVRLDASRKFVEEQAIAGGASVPIVLANSNPAAGKVEDSSVQIPGGRASFTTRFRPASEGETEITVNQPQGFGTPKDMASWTVSVRKPGIAVSDQLVIGRDLEVAGVLNLGQYPPEDGVRVTLTSLDPKQLLLSKSDTAVGSESIEITIPPNETTARYYIQALSDSGSVKYTASAPGYKTRTALVTLAPSGVVLTPISQGPPDEAQIMRHETSDGVYRMSVELSKPFPMKLVAWTVQLDPITHRSADITVQPLRAGVNLAIRLTNSKPEIGTVAPEVTIPAGSDHAIADFTALSQGSTQISVVTPEGLTPSANSTSVVALVR